MLFMLTRGKVGKTLINNVSCSMKYGESRSVVSDSLRLHGINSPWNSPGQNTGVSNRSLLQGIFPTPGSNPGLLHCWQILYQLSHQGSPKILSGYHIPSPGDLPDPGIDLGSPALQADSLPAELPGKPISFNDSFQKLFYLLIWLCQVLVVAYELLVVAGGN